MEQTNLTVNIRGVNFANLPFDEVIEELERRLDSQDEQTALYTPNSEIVQCCIDDNSLYEVINSAEMVVPDGIGVIKAARILGTPFRGGKVAGIEVGEEIFRRAANTAHSVFFLGGKPGVAETARDAMLKKYPGVNVVGCHDGYFKKEGDENAAVIDEINRSGAVILYVCLGAPAQEKWIYQNRASLSSVRLMMGLGGSLDGYAGIAKRAPKIFIKLGLEWFYRLLKEPKRIGRMMSLPKFYFGTLLFKLSKKA